MDQFSLPRPPTRNQFYQRSLQLITPHLGTGYADQIASLLARIHELPRRKKIHAPLYGSWSPAWIYHRVTHKLQFGRYRPPKFELPKS